MTTIVATRKAMYCDSRVGLADTHYCSDKVYRIKGSLLGTSGDNAGIAKFLKWFKGGRKGEPEFGKRERCDVLELNAAGIFLYSDCVFADRVHDAQWFAVGTGAPAALAALMAGVTPERAIEIACALDKESGLPVQVHRL